MKFRSTRTHDRYYSFSEALQLGLADDGGLFVPETFPKYDLNDFQDLYTFPEIAYRFLQPFFKGDSLDSMLKYICSHAFNFPLPLVRISEHREQFELFHGPTGAFKDIGARFLAQCMHALNVPITVLVATSGDTGSAVAAAFHKMDKIKVVVLFPKGKISAFQEKQLTCWDSNILSLRVQSDFDACQRLVKTVFADQALKHKFHLSSANSINIGRLLPQCAYYVAASLWYHQQTGAKANFIIPTGNMGNALAAIWARFMGFPISKIGLATNANTTISEYFASGKFIPRESIATIANAMDVGNPSNMERYLDLAPQTDVFTYSVADEQIRTIIQQIHSKYGKAVDPHTATAYALQDEEAYIVVSTAHPAKFADIVEPLIGTVPLSSNLQKAFERPVQVVEIADDLEQLVEEIEKFTSK